MYILEISHRSQDRWPPLISSCRLHHNGMEISSQVLWPTAYRNGCRHTESKNTQGHSASRHRYEILTINPRFTAFVMGETTVRGCGTRHSSFLHLLLFSIKYSCEIQWEDPLHHIFVMLNKNNIISHSFWISLRFCNG